ncbi:hypothetical protein [Methylophaga sulfidovorans]|uniref:Lipoprotein n=1 Tax=Methylophaga sulfidovorans TaxID=45496 RepID=A0A1I4AQH5_9GAMM|nr:hypothetical protein [Methylophaga sulfidovorans]SFK58788.1 hypothetical protein SAMN04488079_11566 [Methylophaga sulfidovorans]
MKYSFLLLFILVLSGCGHYGRSSSCEGEACQNNNQFVLVGPKYDEAYAKRFNVPSLPLLINNREVTVYAKWERKGYVEGDIRKALLECGVSDFKMSGDYSLMRTLTTDEYNGKLLLIKRCMLDDGFTFLGDFSPCESDPIPACDLPVPKRDIKRRLDSEYCIRDAYLTECEPQSRERILNTEQCKRYPKEYYCDV